MEMAFLTIFSNYGVSTELFLGFKTTWYWNKLSSNMCIAVALSQAVTHFNLPWYIPVRASLMARSASGHCSIFYQFRWTCERELEVMVSSVIFFLQRILIYASFNWLVFITVVESVYSAVRTGSLNEAFWASGLYQNKQRLVPLTA